MPIEGADDWETAAMRARNRMSDHRLIQSQTT